MKTFPFVSTLLAGGCAAAAVATYVFVGHGDGDFPMKADPREVSAAICKNPRVDQETAEQTSNSVDSGVSADSRLRVGTVVKYSDADPYDGETNAKVMSGRDQDGQWMLSARERNAQARGAALLNGGDVLAGSASGGIQASAKLLPGARQSELRKPTLGDAGSLVAKRADGETDPTASGTPVSTGAVGIAASQTPEGEVMNVNLAAQGRRAWPRGLFTPEQQLMRAQVGWSVFVNEMAESARGETAH